MTMLSFALLAKAMHVIENTSDFNLVAVRHIIDCLVSGYKPENV